MCTEEVQAVIQMYTEGPTLFALQLAEKCSVLSVKHLSP